jgi:bifunctional UDP-N-acetylglucosamine pyrophosphorylase/glucosamine-1-phosphate N-acetyltransferase
MATNSNLKIRAVLLAAGQGKRFKSNKPKVLHEVMGRPILSYLLNAFNALNAEHIYVIVGHEAQQVTDYVETYGDQAKSNRSCHLQKPQLGTGHALLQIVDELKDYSGTLIVSVADVPLLTSLQLSKLIEEHEKHKASITLLTTLVDDPKNYGRILRNSLGKVERIVEDKDADANQKKIKEVNPAIYCFHWPEIKEGLLALKNDNKAKEYYLTDLIDWANKNGKAVHALIAHDWLEVAGVNSRVELADLNTILNDRTLKNLALECGVTIVDPKSTWISPDVKIGQDTVILPGTYLVGEIEIGSACTIGPNTNMTGKVKIGNNTKVIQSYLVNSIIGDDCSVGPFAHIRENSIIGNKCRIGNYVEIKNTKISDNTNVSHLSYVGDAEIGSGTNLGAGTITANYNHVTKNKSKTIIGDGSSTGSNSVLVAPVVIGNNCIVAAGTVVTRDVPDGALAVGRIRQENKDNWVDKKLSKK